MKLKLKLNTIFKESLANYIYSLKYFFVPLGVFFLGLLIGTSITFPLINKSLSVFSDGLNSIIQDANFDFPRFTSYIFNALKDEILFNSSAQSIFNKSFLLNIFNNALKVSLENYETHLVLLSDLINECVQSLFLYTIDLLIWILCGIFGGYFLLKFLLRRKIAKRALYKFLIISIIDSLLTTTIVALIISLIRMWAPSGLISTTLILLVYGFLSLFEAYLVHGFKKIKIKEILKFNNVSWIVFSNIFILFITFLLTLISGLLFKELAGFIIGLTLYELSLIVVSLNSESFVKQKVEDQDLKFIEALKK